MAIIDIAHHERAHHAPEEDAVLVLRRHLEVREDEQEDEEVIDRERQLDDVAGEEFEPRLPVGLPEDSPAKMSASVTQTTLHIGRLAVRHRVRLPVEHAQVERQHQEYEDPEPGPSPQRIIHDECKDSSRQRSVASRDRAVDSRQ